ncbi:MAG: ABC transporter substrate-binding protein [Pseudomonadota bacterium]
MKRDKLLIMAGCVLCLAAGVALFVIMLKPERELMTLPTEQDLSHHPVYSTYRFSLPEGVVRIGIQPFWVYGANIAEAMRHDRLLSQDLASLGLRAEFHSFLKGPDINFFMEMEQLDVGMSGYLPTLKMTTLQDIQVPAAIDRNFYDFIAENCFTIKDLEGKTIGFPQGSDAHHALVEALELTDTKARLVPMDLDEMLKTMRDGRLDACIAWEPITSLILSENRNARVVYRSLWVSFLYFRGEFAKMHPQAVRSFLVSQARAIHWIKADPDNLTLSSRWAIDACKELTPDPLPFSLADFVKRSRGAAALSGTPLVFDANLAEGQFLHNAFTFMKKERMISDDAEWQKTCAMFDTKLMRTILGDPLKWRLEEFDYEIQENRT